MTTFHAIRMIACAVILGTVAARQLGAQESPQAAAPVFVQPSATAAGDVPQPGDRRPQAKTPEEAAAYQAFINEKEPQQRIRLIEDFLLHYPETDLKEGAYYTAMQAFQQQNDFEQVLTYGELVLAENPDNLTVLLTLAAAIAEMTDRNDSDRDEKLNEGDQYALKALDVIARLRKPPGFPDERWATMRRDSESAAHAARGLIALIREDFLRAELELKEAVALASAPSATLLYRLGITYSFQKKYAEALEVLDRAASLGGIKIAAEGGGARDLVAEAREFAFRAMSPPAPPPVSPSEVESEAEAPAEEPAAAAEPSPAPSSAP